jgi:hypothetical protein
MGRKEDLIKRISIARNIRGLTCDQAKASVKGYSRKKNEELLRILKEILASERLRDSYIDDSEEGIYYSPSMLKRGTI